MKHAFGFMQDGIDPTCSVEIPMSMTTLIEVVRGCEVDYGLNPDSYCGDIDSLQEALDDMGVYTYLSDNYFEIYGRDIQLTKEMEEELEHNN